MAWFYVETCVVLLELCTFSWRGPPIIRECFVLPQRKLFSKCTGPPSSLGRVACFLIFVCQVSCSFAMVISVFEVRRICWTFDNCRGLPIGNASKYTATFVAPGTRGCHVCSHSVWKRLCSIAVVESRTFSWQEPPRIGWIFESVSISSMIMICSSGHKSSRQYSITSWRYNISGALAGLRPFAVVIKTYCMCFFELSNDTPS